MTTIPASSRCLAISSGPMGSREISWDPISSRHINNGRNRPILLNMAGKKKTADAKHSTPPESVKDTKATDSPRTRRQRQYRLSLGGNTKSQKTLTQINFVNRPYKLDSLTDFDLNYIEEEDDASTSSIATRLLKQKKMRSGGRAKTVEPADTTLTQMGYAIVPDNSDGIDVPTSTLQRVPKTGRTRKRPASSLREEAQSYRAADSELNHDLPPKKRKTRLSGRNKVTSEPEQPAVCQAPKKLDNLPSELPQSSISYRHGVPDTPNRLEDNLLALPVTPRRPHRQVVPSSQSPETPRFTRMNRMTTPDRLPLGSKSTNMFLDSFRDNSRCDSPSPRRKSISPMSSQGDFSLPPPIQTILESPNLQVSHRGKSGTRLSLQPSSPLSSRSTPEAPSKSFLSALGPKSPKDASDRPVSRSSTRSRRTELVVYETDGDSDEEDIFETNSQTIKPHDEIPAEPIARDVFPNQLSGEENSELTESAHDTASDFPASLLYARHYFSYPYEKYMGTILPEGTAEDCQENIETQSEILEPLLPSIPNRRSQRVSPQRTTNPADNLSTESIPESQLQEDSPPIAPRRFASSTAPVILVESSQQPHVIESDDIEQESGPRGILTASQFLPDSLMNSIPAPPGWMSSQAVDTEYLNDNA